MSLEVHELGQVQLRAAIRRPIAGDPAGDVRIAQEGEDLPGGAEHAAALLERRVHVIEHRGGGELEPVVLQDARGLVVVRARRPQERLRDRPLGERGRAQQVTDEFLAGGVEERVRARVRIAVGADERVGQLERATIGGDVGERVPPPVGLARGELLGIEVPHPPLPLAQTARVAAYRSGLFEVANAAPGAASTVGIARELDLPLRGPQMSHCMSSHVAYSR